MADSENLNEQRRKWREEWANRRRNRMRSFDSKGHIWAGVLIILVGLAFLLPPSDLRDIVISWQMLLIAIGLFIGLRHGFRGPAWFILIIVGGTFLITDIYPELSFRQYILPAILITIGLFFILRPRRRRFCGTEETTPAGTTENAIANASAEKIYKEDYIDSTSIFGGIKKNVLSKAFKGGDIVNIFGGSEINLGQADIAGRVELEVTQLFGGTKLVVPSNWEVKPEMTAIFGGIEDKRDMNTVSNPDKVLVLRGTSIFAGIEIKSF